MPSERADPLQIINFAFDTHNGCDAAILEAADARLLTDGAGYLLLPSGYDYEEDPDGLVAASGLNTASGVWTTDESAMSSGAMETVSDQLRHILAALPSGSLNALVARGLGEQFGRALGRTALGENPGDCDTSVKALLEDHPGIAGRMELSISGAGDGALIEVDWEGSPRQSECAEEDEGASPSL